MAQQNDNLVPKIGNKFIWIILIRLFNLLEQTMKGTAVKEKEEPDLTTSCNLLTVTI